MAKIRKALSKGTRFDVFKRDHFTCQYCGAQPPEVVLVVDHIQPVAKGGDNGIDNLVACCEPCNQGKKAKLLSDVPRRPDADLLYLETQQEIAEVERFRESQKALSEERGRLIAMIQENWMAITRKDWCPSDATIIKMLRGHDASAVYEAIEITATNFTSQMDRRDGWVKYTYGVLNRLRAETQNGEN